MLGMFQIIDDRFHEMNTKLHENVNLIETNRDKIDADHQYTHRNCLLVHNLGDMPLYSSKFSEGFSMYMAHKLNSLFPNLRWMGRKLTHGDIDTSHPLKSRRKRNKKLAVVKFKNRDLKNKILNMKNSIRSPNVLITEHLTQQTVNLLRRTEQACKGRKVWTEECKVFVEWGKHGKCIPDEKSLVRFLDQTETKPAENSLQETNQVTGSSESSTNSFNKPPNPPIINKQRRSPPAPKSPATDHLAEQRRHFRNLLEVHIRWTAEDRDHTKVNNSNNQSPIYNPTWAPCGFPSRNGRGRGRDVANRGRTVGAPNGSHSSTVENSSSFTTVRNSKSSRGKSGSGRGRWDQKAWGRGSGFFTDSNGVSFYVV